MKAPALADWHRHISQARPAERRGTIEINAQGEYTASIPMTAHDILAPIIAKAE